MKKVNFFLDSVFTTVLIFIGIGLLSQIPLGDIVNPIEKMFGDFELTDIVFSRLRQHKQYDERVTLINIGNMSRAQIAREIEIINQYNPKVIGIDAFFRMPKEPTGDSALVQAFSKVKNLVLVSELIENTATGKIDSIKTSHPMFMKYAYSGFADMISEGRDLFKTSRVCIPKDKIGDSTYYSFPTMMAYLYDKETTGKYLARNKDTEIINFQGNIDMRKDGTAENSKLTLTAMDHEQVFKSEFDGESIIKDKIIIMGFMGDDFNDPAWIDKFFTPVNKNYVGKTYPDMFGVVVHANIVSMILQSDFIDVMPENLNLALSVLLVFLNVWMLTICYHRLKDWYEGCSSMIVLVEVLLLILCLVLVFENLNYKFDISFVLVALFLSGNFIEIYQGILKIGFFRVLTKIEKSKEVDTSKKYLLPLK